MIRVYIIEIQSQKGEWVYHSAWVSQSAALSENSKLILYGLSSRIILGKILRDD